VGKARAHRRAAGMPLAGESTTLPRSACEHPSPEEITMALPHAHPLDVIDLRPLGPALTAARSTSLLKTERLQLMRLVLQAGQDMPSHAVDGPLTLHCLEGNAVVETPTRTCVLQAGELVMLEGREPHAVRSAVGASLLVTLVLHPA